MSEPDPPLEPDLDEPGPPLLRGWGGCALWAAAFVFVVVAGCSIGLVLRPDPSGTSNPTTAATGDGWSIRVYVDEADDPCTDLFAGNPKVTGQCGYESAGAYRITSAQIARGRYVAFAPTPDDAAEVRVTYSDGSERTVPTAKENGVRFFAVESPVDVEGPATLLDEDGEVLPLG